jgi:CHAP domain
VSASFRVGLRVAVILIGVLLLGARVARAQDRCSGDPLAIWESVGVYSNAPYQRQAISCNPTPGPYGFQFQCVEFINRFFKTDWYGNAYTYFLDAETPTITKKAKGLVTFRNGGTVIPEPDDILVFDQPSGAAAGLGRYGHVALITAVTPTSVTVLEQNWSATGVASIPMSSVTSGTTTTYTVASRAGHPVLGWVRAPLRIEATLDGMPWPALGTTGSVEYTVSGPVGSDQRRLPDGTKVPDRAVNYPAGALPEGSYTVTYISGGPDNSTLVGIGPSETQTLRANSTVTFTLQFESNSEVLPLIGTDIPTSPTLTYGIGSYQFLAQQFVVTTPIQVNYISLPIEDFGGVGGGQLTVWLTNSIGPGTSSANVLFQGSASLPSAGGTIETISLSTNFLLAPGTYYLVLSSPISPPQAGGWLDSTELLADTAGSATSGIFSTDAPGGVLDANFPPASDFVSIGLSNPFAFQIFGTPQIIVPML